MAPISIPEPEQRLRPSGAFTRVNTVRAVLFRRSSPSSVPRADPAVGRLARGMRLETTTASRSACQFHGSNRSSSMALVRPETVRSSTSVSQAKGSTPFSFAVATRLATIAR